MDVQILELRRVGNRPRLARCWSAVRAFCSVTSVVALRRAGAARDVAFSLLEIGLGAGEQAFHLPDLGFDGAAVEREQQVALAHQGAVAEVHAGDFAALRAA